MLSKWGIAFQGINVHGNPAGQREMEQLGIKLVPATVLGEQVVHGWNPAALAEMFDIEFSDIPYLNPEELAELLDSILYNNQHLIKKVPADKLDLKYPGRDRALRDLSWHIFRLSLAFVDCMEQGKFEADWLREDSPPDIVTGVDVADYGDRSRKRITEWMQSAPPETFQTVAHTYYGDITVHQLLERTSWHAGQHLRQVYDLLETSTFLPANSLPMELFEGLPMLDEVW